MNTEITLYGETHECNINSIAAICPSCGVILCSHCNVQQFTHSFFHPCNGDHYYIQEFGFDYSDDDVDDIDDVDDNDDDYDDNEYDINILLDSQPSSLSISFIG